MASKAALIKTIAVLASAFPRDVTEPMIDAYRIALLDLDDKHLETAVGRALRECKFFPSPAEIRERAGANTFLAIDIERLLAAISALGSYNASVGWILPDAETVQRKFGHAVATAFVLAGQSRCYSENDTSRDIAKRAFVTELAGHERDVAATFLIGAPADAAPLLALPEIAQR